MYFTSDQRDAFRRIPHSVFSNNVRISEIDGLFELVSIDRPSNQHNIPTFYSGSIEEVFSRYEYEKVCLLSFDLSVKYSNYSKNRNIINNIIMRAESSGYIVEDSIVISSNISAGIIFAKQNSDVTANISSFIPNYNKLDKIFNLHFRNPKDSIRLKSMLSGDFYEPDLLNHVLDNYSGGAVLDVGANVGNHSVFFGHYLKGSPDFSLDAFEPEASAHRLLVKNLSTNEISSKISIHNIAIGSKNGSVDLNSGSSKNLGAAKVIRSSDDRTLNIPMKPLDEIVSPTKKVSIIKMDIEGFESEALLGSHRILSENSPILYIEAASNENKNKIDKILLPLGYKSIGVVNDTPTHIYTKEI